MADPQPRPDAQRRPRPDAQQPPQADPQRPLRADARRNREKILRAAREVFAIAGFGVPLDEIAARAGVGPGTVYRHFPDKEALFSAVAAARVTDLAAYARARAGDPDPGAAFFGFLACLREEGATKRDLPDVISVPGPLLADLHGAMEVLLRRAQDAGAVRPGVTVPELIIVLKGVLAAIGEAGERGTGRELADRWFAILADGLRPPPEG